MIKEVSLIAAMCQNRGIGLKGNLPWRIPGDMAFFKKITTNTHDTTKKNAVLMGRKTWDSIPVKFRPMPGRINAVISTTMSPLEDVLVFRNFKDALASLSVREDVEQIFVIGGATIYKLALESDHCDKIYLTEIAKDFDCDVFFPDFNQQAFKSIRLPDVPDEEKKEKGIPYKFNVYQKVNNDISLSDYTNKFEIQPFVYIVAAMELNRGIGNEGKLPWPYIEKDYIHWTSKLKVTEKGKYVAAVMGRKSWLSAGSNERHLPNVLYFVISGSNNFECSNETCYIGKSYSEVLNTILQLMRNGYIEKICILGGQNVYKEAIENILTKRVYLTRILANFTWDVCFPEFEKVFKLDESIPTNSDVHEENEIKYKFEEYIRL